MFWKNFSITYYSISLLNIPSWKQGTYVNMEGRAQQTYPALVPPGQARVDWKIIRVLSEVLDEKLPFDNIGELRARMAEVAPNLVRYGSVEQANFFNESLKLIS